MLIVKQAQKGGLIMNAGLIQIGFIFITISIIIPTFILSLTIPYILELWNAVHKEIDGINPIQKTTILALKEDAEKLEKAVSKFNVLLLKIVGILVSFCVISFFVGIFSLIGCTKILPIYTSLVQFILGVLSGGLIGYGIKWLISLMVGIDKMKTFISFIMGLVCLILAILGGSIFYLYIYNLKNLMLIMLSVQVVLLLECIAMGTMGKPAQKINEFRLKRLKEMGIDLKLNSTDF